MSTSREPATARGLSSTSLWAAAALVSSVRTVDAARFPSLAASARIQNIPSATAPSSSSSLLQAVTGLPRGGASKDDAEKDHHQRSSKASKKSSSRSKKSRSSSDHPRNASSRSTSSSNRKRPGSTNSHHKKDSSAGKGDDTFQKKSVPPPPPIVEEILQHDDYYQVLGLEKSDIGALPASVATERVKKAYRRRALQTHPDKTDGDRRAFDKVAEAYDVLSDDAKRKLYDRFGKRGVDSQSGGGGGGFGAGAAFTADDLFRSFFGGAMPFGNNPNNPFFRQQQQQQSQRNRTARYQLEVTLEELYQGATRSILVAPPSSSRRRLDPDSGNNNSKRVQVDIPRGATAGETIVLSGEMDFDATETPGDLILELTPRPHALFTRKHYDLAVSVKIRWSEALLGVRRRLRHLNGQELILESYKEQEEEDTDLGDAESTWSGSSAARTTSMLIQDGDVQVLKGYGMPKDAQGTEFGDLYVQYHVTVPQTTAKTASLLTEDEKRELGRLLDKLEGVHTTTKHKKDAKKNVLHLQPASASDFGRASGAPRGRQHDHHHDFHHHHGDGPPRSQFFFSSSGTTSNPFFGMRQEGMFHEEDVDENMQCQQM